MVLKELIFNIFYLGSGCGGLDRTDCVRVPNFGYRRIIGDFSLKAYYIQITGSIYFLGRVW